MRLRPRRRRPTPPHSGPRRIDVILYFILHYTIPYHTIPYYNILYYTVLYCSAHPLPAVSFLT